MKVLKNELLQESSMSRLYKHNEKHECASLTAYRSVYTKKENEARNRSLKSKLLSLGYDLTEINGVYPEGGVDSSEISFFVVDSKDTGNLERDVVRLSEEFEQDSVLFMPVGSVKDTSIAYLIGTNHNDDNFLKYHEKNHFKKGAFFGEKGEYYTSYVNGRPFTFKENVKKPTTGKGWWMVNITANKNWKDLI